LSKKTTQTLAKDFHRVRLKRLKGFTDGYEVVFSVAKCPFCKIPLLPKRAIVSIWPYIHGDLELWCVDCGFTALFGIPADPVVGMELIILDSVPETVLERANRVKRPVCPFHMKHMRLTKIFGNYIRDDDKIRLQWKCPKWFLTEHKDVPRTV